MIRILLPCLFCLALAEAKEWSIPVAGNAYRSEPSPGNASDRRGLLRWSDPSETYSVFFRVDRPASLELALEGSAHDHATTWQVKAGNKTFEVEAGAQDKGPFSIGTIKASEEGYLRVDISGGKRAGPDFGSIKALLVRSATDALKLSYVKSNQGNMFYWGRRGPSVHLGYALPKGRDIEWAYSEITVPKGRDPIGSYFMANGFAQGYFGMQVKSPRERWVLFSVWSPFRTNNPRKIPQEDRVKTLATGRDVRARKFGGEGSGGQSFLVYPWKAGKTYRFLTRVQPGPDQTTTFTSWFGDKEAGEWRLIASFKRPKTTSHYRGFHSFLENFSPNFGMLQRSAMHGNQWVCDTEGNWHEITRARFTVDATGGGGHRLDYAGGVSGGSFFLKNGGFFAERVKPNQWFKRPSFPDRKPQIDFAKLPTGK